MNEPVERQTVWQIFRDTFGRGLVVLIPVVITVWVLNLLFSAIDGIISPIFDRVLNQHIPGLGFVSMIVLIMVVGALSRNLIGVAVFRFFERIIFSIPLARTIYSAMKDLIKAFQPGARGRSFREVVLIDYPRMGLKTVGFMTNKILIRSGETGEEMVSVYVPNPPNPTSGALVFVPRDTIRVLDMSVEEGLKLVLSGGIVTPMTVKLK